MQYLISIYAQTFYKTSYKRKTYIKQKHRYKKIYPYSGVFLYIISKQLINSLVASS